MDDLEQLRILNDNFWKGAETIWKWLLLLFAFTLTVLSGVVIQTNLLVNQARALALVGLALFTVLHAYCFWAGTRAMKGILEYSEGIARRLDARELEEYYQRGARGLKLLSVPVYVWLGALLAGQIGMAVWFVCEAH